MTDFDEINARLLAERDALRRQSLRPSPEAERIGRKLETERAARMDKVELLAAQFHQLWSDKGFEDPLSNRGGLYGHLWLPIDDTEKLAYQIYKTDFDKYYVGDKPEFSGVYLLLDGRLVCYIGTASWYDEGSWYSSSDELTPFAEYVANLRWPKDQSLVEEVTRKLEKLHVECNKPQNR